MGRTYGFAEEGGGKAGGGVIVRGDRKGRLVDRACTHLLCYNNNTVVGSSGYEVVETRM